jgi:signal transduction histidine kinase
VGVLVGLQRLLRRYVAARAAAEKALRQANEQLNREVEERTSELTDLSRHLIRVAEEEKAKLARELHDTLGSNLTAISMDLNWVAKRLPDARDDLRDRLQRALRMLTETVELKHQVIEGLRPSHLDNLGLTFAMRTHCKEFSRLTGMPCSVEVLEDFDDLDPALSIVLYRVVQEALTNVMKHAQAKQVQVSLRREDGGLRLRIRDDGVGFADGSSTRRASHGLIGMRERVRQVGGSFRVANADGAGALLEVFIPVGAQPASAEPLRGVAG